MGKRHPTEDPHRPGGRCWETRPDVLGTELRSDAVPRPATQASVSDHADEASQRRYEEFVRSWAHRAVVTAAEAAAARLALKFPLPSRPHNERMYRRLLEARFAAIVDDLGQSWTASEGTDPDSPREKS